MVTPSGMPYENLVPDDMIVTDLGMNVIEGKYRPSVALNLWTGFFHARPELHGIVHTHSPYATAFSVANQPIPVITETMADWFGQQIPCAPYLSVEDSDFAALPIQIMGAGYAVLLGQHGVITLGKTLAHALERAVTLEEAARTFFVAKVIGSPLILAKNKLETHLIITITATANTKKKRHRRKAVLTFNKQLVALDLDAVDARTVIEVLAGKLHRQGSVVAEYGQQTYRRVGAPHWFAHPAFLHRISPCRCRRSEGVFACSGYLVQAGRI